MKSVSIPQSGFGAFEQRGQGQPPPAVFSCVSIPQSGFGAFEHDALDGGRAELLVVSIPQSGFGAFELREKPSKTVQPSKFQSLSRDSGRLNSGRRVWARWHIWSFNPSVGIRGV